MKMIRHTVVEIEENPTAERAAARFFTLSMDRSDRGKLSWKATRSAAGKSREIKKRELEKGLREWILSQR